MPNTQGTLNFSQDNSAYDFLDYGTQDFSSEQDYPQFTGLSQVRGPVIAILLTASPY